MEPDEAETSGLIPRAFTSLGLHGIPPENKAPRDSLTVAGVPIPIPTTVFAFGTASSCLTSPIPLLFPPPKTKN